MAKAFFPHGVASQNLKRLETIFVKNKFHNTALFSIKNTSGKPPRRRASVPAGMQAHHLR